MSDRTITPASRPPPRGLVSAFVAALVMVDALNVYAVYIAIEAVA